MRTRTVNTGGLSATPTVGAYLPAGSDEFNPGLLTGIKVGYENIGKTIIDSIGVEGTLNYLLASSKKADVSSADSYLFRLDVTYPFVLPGKWLPSFVLGAGGIYTRNGGESDGSPLINYGVSVKYLLEEWMGWRVDARHLLVYDSVNTRNNFELSMGFIYYFDKERKKVAPPPPDSDRDGVPDASDKCPNTPLGEKVGKTGCPADTDSDGVPDKWDRCAGTPMGVTVDKDGCAVTNGETPVVEEPAAEEPAAEEPAAEEPAAEEPAAEEPAAEVPAAAAPAAGAVAAPPEGEVGAELPAAPQQEPLPEGMAPPAPGAATGAAPAEPSVPLPWRKPPVRSKKVAQVVTVEFPVDGTVIYAKYRSKIRNIAEIMRNNAGATALVEGHTDSSGDVEYNMGLSLRRAESLKKEMVKYGVDPAAVAIKGYGKSRPIAGNQTAEGKQRNRRATATVTIFIYQ